ncbi:MAG: gephyrin-like molybdotransferase Glp, partial [Acidimicrobiales bacterium]
GSLVPAAPRAVPLAEALGCVLAEAVVAREAIPPFANTAMDGFAVQAADTAGATGTEPAVLTVVATVRAGEAPTVTVGPGEAVRIMTGAPMPDGADAVVPVEDLAFADDVVESHVLVDAGRHVRPAGGDATPGEVVLPAGVEVTPAAVGVLASLGRATCTVVRRARVGVLSTGDELVEGAGPLRPGQIRESNRPALLATVRADGFEAVDLGIVPDDEASIRAAIKEGAASCDAVLTTGGVSMGEADHVKGVLDELSGGTYRWFQVAIRPAKPFAFGTVAGTPVFGLPGNPVSCLVSYELFGRPGIRRRMGFTSDRLWRPLVAAEAPDGFQRRPDGKLHLVRVAVERHGPRWLVRERGSQASNALTALAVADALALVPDGGGIPPGGSVSCWMLRG